MRSLVHTVLTLTVVLSSGCGGTQQPATATPASGGPAAGEGGAPAGHEDHGDLPASIGAFHEIIRPLWHSPAGPERVAKACEGVADLQAAAAKVDQEPAPAHLSGDIEGWRFSKMALTATVNGLAEACGAEGRPEVEARFGEVHDAFEEIVGKSTAK